MTKQNFIKQFPDVCAQDIVFSKVLSRSDVEKKALSLVESLNTGLLGYEYLPAAKRLKVFTSYNFKDQLSKMIKGCQVLDENTGLVGTITSDEPFICSAEMCVRVDFGSRSDVFSCTYFKM